MEVRHNTKIGQISIDLSTITDDPENYIIEVVFENGYKAQFTANAATKVWEPAGSGSWSAVEEIADNANVDADMLLPVLKPILDGLASFN